MKLRSLLLAVLLLVSGNIMAQSLRCGFDDKLQEQLERDPYLWEKRQAIEEFTERWIEEHGDNQERVVYTIPVVVHVIYKTAGQNISNAQVFSQINALNEDYRGTNSEISSVPSVWNSLIADCEIEFALAERTPDAQETNGITRTETTVSNWGGSDNVKFASQGGINAWPTSDYLNIWVCNIGGGLLGFAYPPGISPSLDGLVIGYRYFGTEGTLSSTYNLGRTATHEIGHYFNLEHPWGIGGSNQNCTADDNVSDTPIQSEPNYGCETFPHISCNNGPNGDMFNNFMDYSDDDCLWFFTNGQKARMLAALNGPREALLTSNALTPPVAGIEDNPLNQALTVYPNPTSDFLHLKLNLNISSSLDIRLLDSFGRLIIIKQNVLLSQGAYQLDVSELSSGMYILQVISPEGQTSRKINILR